MDGDPDRPRWRPIAIKVPPPECLSGVAAVRILEVLADRDVLVVVSHEARADAILRALRAAAPAAEILACPASDALPGDVQPATPGNVGRRVAALRRARAAELNLKRSKARPPLALIATAEAASRLLPAPKAFSDPPPAFKVGDPFNLAKWSALFTSIGYLIDDRVDEPGEIAFRGKVVDVFPADGEEPVRLEIVGDRIASIRTYDPLSQRGAAALGEVAIGPANEPVIQGKGATIFDHLPSAMLMLDPAAEVQRDRFLALAADATRGGVSLPALAVTAPRWKTALAGRDIARLAEDNEEPSPRFAESADPIKAAGEAVRQAIEEEATVVLAGAQGDLRLIRRRLDKMVGEAPLEMSAWSDLRRRPRPRYATLEAPIDQGWRAGRLMVVASRDVLGSRAEAGGEASDAQDVLPAGSEVGVGDVVIHEDHGVAIVRGLRRLPALGGEAGGDAFELEYAGGARRLIPVEEGDRIWRYGADAGGGVMLDKLDGSSWIKRRAAIDRAITESAQELSRIAEEARARKAVKIDPPPALYERFASGFAFNETADQARAIEAVRTDLSSGKPMDRLVVGDVGYGKTEVALRAAALTALAGRQVVIAAPTTVLVRQHVQTFERRFRPLDIKVASLSRLSSAADNRRVKEALAAGEIDIVIGTGAVASDGIAYRKLGLVVIDEEQRFGAADKERLRALSEEAHLLTLTATPIPRTLQTALVGLKRLSIIATPPARRQPIRTSVGAFDDVIVRAALLREKSRLGQSFVVVPRIEDMSELRSKLARLTPDLVVREAHGDLPAAVIDEEMVKFASGDGDILLATNIIETGLDVPRANTMIIWRADRFGLSQLHQLRGRVGRGSRRGQILLTTAAGKPLPEATLKRLKALQTYDRLGAGFDISARDLDLRGAGDLLGEAQTGHLKLIGVELYQYLLERAVRSARGEAIERWTPHLNFGAYGHFPAEWIPETDTRLALYLRLAAIADLRDLEAFSEELADRFGELPVEALIFLRLAKLRRLAHEAEIARIDAGPEAIALTPRRAVVKGARALGLEQRDKRLVLQEAIKAPMARIERAQKLLEGLIQRA